MTKCSEERIKSRKVQFVVMMGDDPDAPGGIATVARHYRDCGLFAKWPVVYISSYQQSGFINILLNAWAALWKLLTLLVRGQVALLHVHCASRGSFWRKTVYCLIARLFGVNYLVHLHGGEFPLFYSECGPVRRGLIKFVITKASKVIALSAKWREWLTITFPGAQVSTIGNPVSIPSLAAPVPNPVILFMGRMYPEKGVLELIRAVGSVRNRVKNIRLVLAGTSSEKFEGEIRMLCQDLGIEENVLLPGWVSGEAKKHLMDECAIFALPSYAEGLPLGLLEAMAAGKAVITTPVGGIPDVVNDGINGILVPPKEVDALAAAIEYLVTNMGACSKLGERARATVEAEFADTVVFAEIGKIYQSLGILPVQNMAGT